MAAGRLVLEPLAVAHADEMAVVLGDPELHTFIGGTPATAAELRARYARLVAGSPDPGVRWCNWVIRLRSSGALVGTVQATITGPVAEIAWVVGVPWQGRGLAAEAARELIDWLAGQSVRTVLAHIHPDHRASQAVAARAGLHPTDIHQDGEIRWVRQITDGPTRWDA